MRRRRYLSCYWDTWKGETPLSWYSQISHNDKLNDKVGSLIHHLIKHIIICDIMSHHTIIIQIIWNTERQTETLKNWSSLLKNLKYSTCLFNYIIISFFLALYLFIKSSLMCFCSFNVFSFVLQCRKKF